MTTPLFDNDDSAPRRRLVTIAEVAHWLGVEVRHVRRLVAERRIPFIKWGHLLRFDPEEIQDWIDRNRWPVGGHPAAPPPGSPQVRSIQRRRSAPTEPQGQQPSLLPLPRADRPRPSA